MTNVLNKKVIVSFLIFLATTCVWGNQNNTIPEVTFNPKNAAPTAKKANISQQTIHFDREEIEQSPDVTPLSFLQQNQSIVRLVLPTGDPSQTALSIRGFGENAAANSLILVDGFPLINPSLLAPNLNSILLNDIERFDIFQGSQGTRWGNQAVGGVVNIITRHPQAYFADIDMAFGGYQKRFLSFFAGNQFSHGVFMKAFLVGNQYDHLRHHNKQAGWNAAVTGGIDYGNGSISVNLQKYEDFYQVPGGLTPLQYQQNPQQASNHRNFTQLKSQALQLLAQQTYLNNWLFETRLQHLNTNGHGIFTWDFTRLDESNLLSERIYGNMQQHRILIGSDILSSKFHFNNTKADYTVKDQQKYVYAQLISPINNWVDLTLGIRYAQQHNQPSSTYSVVNSVFVSEQGVSFNPRADLSFYIRRDGNFRFPKTNEVVFTPTITDQLAAQIGLSYEAGLIWLLPHLKTELNLYELILKNEIAFNPTPTPLQHNGSFYNFDKTNRKGFSIIETYQLLPKVKINTQFNYVNPRLTSGMYSGNMIPAVPNYTGNLAFMYQIHPEWVFKYYLLYTGTRYPANDIANQAGKLHAYWLHDVNLQYIHLPVLITFEILNLFNQIYPIATAYSASKREITYYPGEGRRFLLTMKVNIE